MLVVGSAKDVANSLKKFSVNGKVTYYDIYGEEYDPSTLKLPEGLTAKKVIENYINAIGGEEVIKKVHDRVTILKGKVQGMDLTVTISQKAPNKYMMNLNAGVMQQIQKFDGEKGIASAMGQSQPMGGKELENMKIESIMFAELQYAKLGVITELVGAEELNGKEVYKLVVTIPSGKVTTKYFDAESGLQVKEVSTIETPQGNFTQTVEFSNYKDVEGVLYPYTINQQMGPQSIPLKVESVTINSGLDDSIFSVE